MKLYFAGSIRGGRADAALYARLIARMQRRHRVLTEHIGAPSAFPTVEADMTDAEIWKQDMAWLRECDLVIAECTTPSHGVGYELAMAQQWNKPVHIFYDARRAVLSAMLTGDPYYTIHPYESEEALIAQLDALLEE
ncbi:MAG: C-Myc-responsive protein Rcl [Ruminococcaceae bacterium]|nr:C-Myc-responsive protein Rcl [Oscillospiraceae bacterium]